MKIDDIIVWETPAFADYISIPFLQNLIAKYVVWKVKRKMKRYNAVIARVNFLKKYS